jgi:hypothetical protein
MLALRCFDRVASGLSQTKEPRPRPVGAGYLTSDDREGPIAPAVPFDPVRMDKHGVGSRHAIRAPAACPASEKSALPAYKHRSSLLRYSALQRAQDR